MSLKLAIDVICEYHGPVVAAVAAALFNSGPQTLGELVRKKITVLNQDTYLSRTCFLANPSSSYNEDATNILSTDMIKSALVILVRYQIVQLEVKNIPKTTATGHENAGRCTYIASVSHALMMLRYAPMIEYTRKHVGVKHAYVIEELLVNGSSSLNEIVEQLALRVSLRNDNDLYDAIKNDLATNRHSVDFDYYEDEPPDENETEETLLKTVWAKAAREIFTPIFESLVANGIIVRFPTFGIKTVSFVDQEKGRSDSPDSSKSKRVKREDRISGQQLKKKRENSIAEDKSENILTHSLELKVMLERAKVGGLNESNRHIEAKQSNKIKQEDSGISPNGSNGNKKSLKRPRPSRKEPLNPRTRSEWMRVNPNYFLEAFRQEMIEQYIVEKTGEEVIRKIPQIAFNLSRRKPRDKSTENGEGDFIMPSHSKTISARSLLQLSISTLESKYPNAGEKVFSIYLTLLANDPKKVVEVESDGVNNEISDVRFNWELIIKELKANCVLNIIAKRFGRKGARIIRLLLDRGALEEQQIGDLSMMPRKEARSTLYALLKGGLLLWEEAPKRSDFHASYCFHLWSVNLDKIIEIYREACYKSMLNMRIRYRALSQHNKELDRFTAYEDDVANGIMTEEEMMQVPGVGKYHKYRLAFDKLDCAMLNLDKSCMLLAHF